MAEITVPIQVNLPDNWIEQVIERLRNDPDVDWVEITRCRYCKHYYYADNRIPQEQRYVCDIGGEKWKPDDFCSYAERRVDGSDRKMPEYHDVEVDIPIIAWMPLPEPYKEKQ